MIAVCPIITNVWISLYDQIWDSQCIQASSDHESILSTTNNENSRIGVFKLDALFAEFEPVLGTWTCFVNIGAVGSTFVRMLLVAFDFPDGLGVRLLAWRESKIGRWSRPTVKKV